MTLKTKYYNYDQDSLSYLFQQELTSNYQNLTIENESSQPISSETEYALNNAKRRN